MNISEKRLTSPFLRWAGSKKQLINCLSSYWSLRHKRYIEPFLGSGCLFFSITPPNAVLGDINKELIITYEQIREHPIEVSEGLTNLKNERDEYYRIRAMNPDSLTHLEIAVRFIYLNRYSFNGLYRTNKSGQFNVPYGGYKTGNLPLKEKLLACSLALTNVTLVAGDFELLLNKTNEDDFVYLDPPYNVSSLRVFNQYDSLPFNNKDLFRLKQSLNDLNNRGTKFVVTYAECEEAYILSEGYSYKIVSVKRNIAGFAKMRVECNELIISNITK